MKISIITAVFNRADTIGRAIESIQAQKGADLELVVIDGASTDGSLAIAKRCLDHRGMLVSEPDQGIYDAINKGIRCCTGDIIGLMHSDDFYASNDALEQVLTVFDSGDFDAVYGDVAFFHPERPNQIVRRYSSKRFNPSRIPWGWMPAHTALFFRKGVFQNHGLYRTDYKIAADFELVARVFYSGNLKSHYLPKVLVHMSTGGASTAGWRSTLLLNREVMRACRDNGISTNWLKILSKYPWKLLELLRS